MDIGVVRTGGTGNAVGIAHVQGEITAPTSGAFLNIGIVEQGAAGNAMSSLTVEEGFLNGFQAITVGQNNGTGRAAGYLELIDSDVSSTNLSVGTDFGVAGGSASGTLILNDNALV